ncbi:MAG: anthranilate synthase component I family protein [Hadesarchaea archaeon]|nr:anthranilate synthase component I family protein [Hadesarchaea archaeon]
MLPSLVIVFDHEKKQTYYSSLLLLTDETNFEKAHSRAIEELRELTEKKLEFKEEDYQDISVRENISEDDFKDCVGKIRKYIRMGDIIQAVLSRRIDLDPCPPLGKFYSELREINPSPYMFFLDFPGQSIIGSSPEALVRVQENKVLTRPIAGTRRRGKDATEDAEMEEELLSDEKERAEHVMLVDLARNDIGKISKFGSIETPEFMEVEKYGDVQHIVSTVVGELESNVDAFDTLRSVFPAGTVSGAPKVRAMEIIEELEPSQRGIYSGAVGTFSYTGDADFAITIRSLTASNGKGQIQVGAGIVADSVPWKEYYETKNKAQSLLRAAGVKNASGSDR